VLVRRFRRVSRLPSGRTFAVLAVVLAGVVGWSAPAATAATTLFTGRFVCEDRGVQLPLAGAQVKIFGKPQDRHGFLGLGDATFFYAQIGADQTGADGEWSFAVHRRQGNEQRYNFYVQVSLDDGDGTTVSDWPAATPVSFSTDTNQNDVAVQDYHTLALPGGECALWLALKHAREDYNTVTGQPTPFGGTHAQYDGPNVGWPYTAYDTIIWPRDYPPGPGPGSQVAAIHEFAHLVRNSSLGSEGNFLHEVEHFDYRRRGNDCRRTSPQQAFHEGWPEFWARDFQPSDLCSATPDDPAVEADVAWTLTRLEPTCGRRRMVAALLAHGQSIHSLGDFQRFLGSCVAVPLSPGSVPRSPIFSPVRAGRWITDIQNGLNAARGAASRLGSQLATVRRAASNALCVHPPCYQALERRVGPEIIEGRLAQARLLANALASQVSTRTLRLVSGKPTRAFLDLVRTAPRALTRGLARIGVQSLSRALAAGRLIILHDHTVATATVIQGLRAARVGFGHASRRGLGLPFSLSVFNRRTPKLKTISGAGVFGGRWTAVSSGAGPVSLALDGSRVVAAYRVGGDTIQVTTLASGARDGLAVVNRVTPFSGWAAVGDPLLLPRAGGGLQMLFDGARTTTFGEPLSGMILVARAPDGSFPSPQVASSATDAELLGGGAVLAADGATPLWAGTFGGLRVFRGASNAAEIDLSAYSPGTNYAPTLAYDHSGRLWLAWYAAANDQAHSGLYLLQLDPATGEPLAGVTPFLAPLSYSSNTPRLGLACAATCRLVYIDSSSHGHRVLSWEPGDHAPTTVATSPTGDFQTPTAGYRSDRRLWVAWADRSTTRIDAKLGDTNGAGGTQLSIRPPAGAIQPTDLESIVTGGQLALTSSWLTSGGSSQWATIVSG
jgi:hypothetical protein